MRTWYVVRLVCLHLERIPSGADLPRIFSGVISSELTISLLQLFAVPAHAVFSTQDDGGVSTPPSMSLVHKTSRGGAPARSVDPSVHDDLTHAATVAFVHVHECMVKIV